MRKRVNNQRESGPAYYLLLMSFIPLYRLVKQFFCLKDRTSSSCLNAENSWSVSVMEHLSLSHQPILLFLGRVPVRASSHAAQACAILKLSAAFTAVASFPANSHACRRPALGLGLESDSGRGFGWLSIKAGSVLCSFIVSLSLFPSCSIITFTYECQSIHLSACSDSQNKTKQASRSSLTSRFPPPPASPSGWRSGLSLLRGAMPPAA